jgi:hypothetical protein
MSDIATSSSSALHLSSTTCLQVELIRKYLRLAAQASSGLASSSCKLASILAAKYLQELDDVTSVGCVPYYIPYYILIFITYNSM